MTTAPDTTIRSRMNNAFETSDPATVDPALLKVVEERRRLLGPAYRLFYQNPVQLSRGAGALLYDKDGNEYLDAYNNVVSVGHAHPKVVEAISAQLRTLTTHTRYIQDGILPFAEKLLATYGGRIGERGHAMFTCTGSEANDLAMRIAQHYTGKRGIIVSKDAYHGNSALTAQFSPSESSALGTWVRCVPAPDSFRHDPAGLGDWFAAQVQAQIDDLEARGEGLAAFIADSMFTSDGIYVEPRDLLAKTIDVVHRAGGLFIADEVQSGFARSGEHMWGYQRHGIDPDIVTMGKPMGNGYPVAGIAVDHDIVAPFGRDVSYFNTFGGNDTAMAAARAVLQVIEEEGLLANAATQGARLDEGLRSLAATYPQIGDVRSSGLYLGVELVAEPGTTVPDPAAAAAIVSGMRERRVLISTTGPDGNILKVRPPLVFTSEHVDRFLTELAVVLGETLG